MPPLEDLEDGDEEEEVDTPGPLPSMPPPPTPFPGSGSGSASAKPSHLDGYKPISASGLFDQALEISVPSAQLNFRAYYTPPKAKSGTVLICHHGAGYSALSFACFAKEVTGLSNGECGVFAFDVRRHGMGVLLFDHNALPRCHNAFTGKTVPTPECQTPDVDANLDIITLVNDCMGLLTTLFPDPATSPSLLVRPPIRPCLHGCIDIRRSWLDTAWVDPSALGQFPCFLNGSIESRASRFSMSSKVRSLSHLVIRPARFAQCVLLEFTLDALPHMHALLHTRPIGFGSIEEGIEWQ